MWHRGAGESEACCGARHSVESQVLSGTTKGNLANRPPTFIFTIAVLESTFGCKRLPKTSVGHLTPRAHGLGPPRFFPTYPPSRHISGANISHVRASFFAAVEDTMLVRNIMAYASNRDGFGIFATVTLFDI